ncbi:MAG TPA: Gfo/Idh/MocA family oxidoreductase [Caulobacteraceae bacterium]|nr:Gfo/Idh/MocA family oxidoreductase [Caulobacteraceae bacterium]
MSDAPLRIGLLAASKIAVGAVIAPAKERDDVAVTAVAARDPARARAYADKHGIAGVAESYGDLLTRDDVDVIYIGNPIAGHAEWAIEAAKAGKPVLCEKSFALNAAEGRAMVAAAEVANQPLLEAFHYRFHNVIRRAEAIVASGELGAIRRADATFEGKIPYDPDEIRWRADQGGGALGDLGTYPCHALRTVMAAEPQVVSSEIEMREGVDAKTAAELEFPGGVPASLKCSMVAERFDATLTLTGERGTLSIRNYLAPQAGCSFRVTVGGATRDEPTDGPSTYAAQLEHLVQVMRHGAAPMTGGRDAIANLELMDAIRQRA